MMNDWVSAAFFTVLAVTSLYEGGRLFGSVGPSRKAVLLVAAGACICVGSAIVSFLSHKTVSEIIAAVTAPPKDLPRPEQWSKSLTPTERENVGRLIAQAEYSQSGTLTSFEDRTHQTITYCPTSAEVTEREAKVAKLSDLRVLEDRSYANALWWFVSGLLSFIAGIQMGRWSRNGL
jgi:hypothetical protein